MRRLLNFLAKPIDIAPLAFFRLGFGVLMFYSSLRFWLKGWIESQYLATDFHFKYYGFEWVEVLPGYGLYFVFAAMLLFSVGIALGWFYRVASIGFALCFIYVELLDVTYYLNHYYFVSLMAVLLCFLPAHRAFSMDVKQGRVRSVHSIPRFYLVLVMLQIGIVYFFAGLAKLNSTWLFDALPLRIWLPAHADLPLLGPLLTHTYTAYLFSWFGALYDLCVFFLLLHPKSRNFALVAVVVFHLLTWILFPIGVFPWVMIASATIFLNPTWHRRVLRFLFGPSQSNRTLRRPSKWALLTASFFLIVQLALPWRYLLYSGNLFWHEQGYRFGWRVMLMEKAGSIYFRVVDQKTGKSTEVDPADYLLDHQLKQMATQADLILQFAHFIEAEFHKQGYKELAVYAHAQVSLNGERSRTYIDERVDLTQIEESFAPKTWILPHADR